MPRKTETQGFIHFATDRERDYFYANGVFAPTISPDESIFTLATRLDELRKLSPNSASANLEAEIAFLETEIAIRTVDQPEINMFGLV